MSMFAWKDNFNIGVAEIDAQHRRLYSLADELYAAMFTGKGKDVMEPVLRNLILGGHFKTGHRGSLQNRPTDHHSGRTCFTLQAGPLASPV